jgi:hypothetical protein
MELSIQRESKKLKSIKNIIKKISFTCYELILIFNIKILLPFCVVVFSKRVCLTAVNSLAWFLAILPEPSVERCIALRKAFNLNWWFAFRAVKEYIRRIMIDFIIAKRIICNKENVFLRKITEKNKNFIECLRNSDKSYIIATGHFAREALIGLYLKNITPGNITIASVSIERKIKHLQDFRTKEQLAILLKAISTVRSNTNLALTDQESKAAMVIYKIC